MIEYILVIGMYYNNLSDFYKNKFGCKVVKLSFDGGFSCPNRVNGSGGCIFCSGSYEYAGDRNKSLDKQYFEQKKVMDRKWPGAKYIAYFGSFTNTFDSVDRLRDRFDKVLEFDNIIGLSIGTRCDCISEKIYEYLKELNERTFLTVELGLQSMHDYTLNFINRGHDLKCFDECVRRLKGLCINVVVHIIDGLPGEDEKMMVDTIRYLNDLDIDGIKIHNLFVVKNTIMDNMYLDRPFKLLSRDEYIDILVKQIRLLKPSIVIHRLTGDPRADDLIEPLWCVKKIDVLNGVVKKLKSDKAYQGIDYKEKELI